MPKYIPPYSTGLPFVFGDMGYSKPKFSPLPFNFRSETASDLQAAINVIVAEPAPPYINEAYTYLKGCPKYILGYTNYGIQILSGRCLYGGIRDLQASIFADDSIHASTDISARIKVFGHISTIISANLQAYNEAYLGAVLEGTHDPYDLSGFIKITSRNNYNLPGSLQAFHISNLTAELFAKVYSGLSSTVNPIPAILLPALLNVWPQSLLGANLIGWGAKDLTAQINQVYFNNLNSMLNVVGDTNKDLITRIKGYGSTYSDLFSSVRGLTFEHLVATLRATYLADLPATMRGINPINIEAHIHGWQETFLPASVNIVDYPWDLKAQLYVSGGIYGLPATLIGKYGVNVSSYLRAVIKSWEVIDLMATIVSDNAHVLSASLNVTGNARDLHASIRPKVIKLTKVINFSTLTAADISATINCSCKQSRMDNLPAVLNVRYKGDLSAYIRPTSIYENKDLSASTGYSDSYSEVDKLKISINFLPSYYFTEDILKININTLRAGQFLGASIVGILSSRDLPARIFSQKIEKFYYEDPIKNREKVIKTDYSGKFESYEVAEFSFKEVVKEYYYSSDGDYTWKNNLLDRWVVNVSSYLPMNTSLNIKRRFHKAFDLYDLRKFDSVDSAMRFAIDYVTEYPSNSISALLNPHGGYQGLLANITASSPSSSRSGLQAYVSAIEDNNVVIIHNQSITKI